MDIAEANDVEVLTTDYCWDTSKMDDSYSKNAAKGYISFAAEQRELDAIPIYPSDPYNMNESSIINLSNAKNFLYLINPSDNESDFPNTATFLSVLQASNYDVLLIDLFFDGTEESELSASEVAALRAKANGGSRIVLAYMSIGEAEDYRYYWKSSWNEDNDKPVMNTLKINSAPKMGMPYIRFWLKTPAKLLLF
ncbi:hypothetical protein [Sediminispirochaeta smaragdinae]|nr:hypothetical protein [Sediminispirochaeta smaragdinae]